MNTLDAQPTVRVAAVQATPAYLDREATLDLACRLIDEAAGAGARLIVFPEAFVPGYPDFVWRLPTWRDNAWYRRLADNSVTLPGPSVERLAATAQRNGAWVVMGVSERTTSGTLHNTLVYLSADGDLAGIHRKLVATGGERAVWGPGDGSTLTVVQTPFGRLGGLTCRENYMPLARAAMYQRGIDIWVAPTWDNADTWQATLRHVAKEGRCFVIGTNSCIRGADVPRTIDGAATLYGGDDDWVSRGNSTIVGPDGDFLAGPLVGEPGILYADLDLSELTLARREFDPVGHYSRPDVFTLHVNRGAENVVSATPKPAVLSGTDAYQPVVPGNSREGGCKMTDKLEARSLDQPDETRRPELTTVEVVSLGEHSIGRFTFKPGWTWASSIKPVAGTEHCEKHHVGYCVAGRMDVWQTEGTRISISTGDAYVIPSGHDAEVVGDEDFVGVEFSSAATYATPRS